MNTVALDHVESQLVGIIAKLKRLPAENVALAPEDDFLAKFDLSSMDAVSLSVEISELFSFGFGETAEDIDSLASFGALTRQILARVAQ